ncbi:MAG: acetolactate synthase [Rhizobiales bacterium]|nr:acetolactate synthase [Hyphomicrobiales bacterium]
MRAADTIVQSLKAHGIKRVYCVPGESYLTLLDALHESGIDVVVCRHEGGAGFMACAEAKLTGEPAVFMVSRGPGATNASIAVHMADQDGLPVILLVGQVARAERTRGVFQEVDYERFLGSMAKGVFEITDGRKLHEILPRSFRLAQQGIPGPVVLSLPEDMLDDPVDEKEPVVFPLATVGVSASDLARIQQVIDASERPVLVVGGALRSAAGKAAIKRFAEAQRLPVAVTWKNQEIFDNASPLYAGHLGFGALAAHRKALQEADLILAIGTRLGDVASLGYTFPECPAPKQTLVHVYPDGKPIGHVFRTDLGLIADPVAVLAGLAQSPRVVSAGREAWISSLNGVVRDLQVYKPVDAPDGMDFGVVVDSLSRLAPRDAIVVTDAGNISTWVHRHWKMTPDNTLIGGIVGAMGLGVPGAVAASISDPKRTAICFVGDGGVLMTGQEIATAMASGAAPKIVISNNGIYGTIRTHQEREFPGRISGTDLKNPDFDDWAKSFGAASFSIARGDNDVDGTVSAFLAAPGPAVLHVRSSRIALSSNVQLKP